jgi:hypothetical protein
MDCTRPFVPAVRDLLSIHGFRPRPLVWGCGDILRREYIYPHRAVRALSISKGRIVAALLLAAVFSVLVARYAVQLFAIHGNICAFLLNLAQLPVTGWQSIEVFHELGSATAPLLSFRGYGDSAILPSLLALLIGGALMALFIRVPLARGFVLFLAALLAAGVVARWVPHLQFDSVIFQQIWLRSEALVWILLPWICGFLFLLGQPSKFWGVAAMLLVPLFGFAWSACRLAFCLGIMHFLGLTVMPLLWFGLGLLADLLYVVTFYSIAIYKTSSSIWGERRA